MCTEPLPFVVTEPLQGQGWLHPLPQRAGGRAAAAADLVPDLGEISGKDSAAALTLFAMLQVLLLCPECGRVVLPGFLLAPMPMGSPLVRFHQTGAWRGGSASLTLAVAGSHAATRCSVPPG